MRKRVFLIVAAVLIIAMSVAIFTACDKAGSFKVSDLESENLENMYYGPATVVKLDADDYISYQNSNESNLNVFTETNEEGLIYHVIDIAQQKELYTGKDEALLTFNTGYSLIFPDVYMVLSSDEEGNETVSFYSEDGVIAQGVKADGLLSNGKIISDRYDKEEGLDIGNKNVIICENGKYTVKEKSVASLNNFRREDVIDLENYSLYFYNYDQFAVLDKNDLSVIRKVSAESITGEKGSSMTSLEVAFLPGDKVLFQQIVKMPDNTTKDYDFYNSSYYYKYYTYIYDIEKDKTETVKNCKYIFGETLYLQQGMAICNVAEITKDKALGSYYIQGFDEDLNVKFDIQAILPDVSYFYKDGDYAVFYSSERMVLYKGDTCVLDVPYDKMDGISMIVQSELLRNTTNNALYNIDGSYLTSLGDLDANEFVYLDYAQNYVLYTKTEIDEVSGMQVEYLCRFDKKTGETQKIAPENDYQLLGYGFILVKNAEDDNYSVYDVVNMNKLIDDIGMGTTYVSERKDVLILTNQYRDELYAEHVEYYVLKRS